MLEKDTLHACTGKYATAPCLVLVFVECVPYKHKRMITYMVSLYSCTQTRTRHTSLGSKIQQHAPLTADGRLAVTSVNWGSLKDYATKYTSQHLPPVGYSWLSSTTACWDRRLADAVAAVDDCGAESRLQGTRNALWVLAQVLGWVGRLLPVSEAEMGEQLLVLQLDALQAGRFPAPVWALSAVEGAENAGFARAYVHLVV